MLLGESGLFDFWDALWIPEAPERAAGPWSPLQLDVVNPHHGSYYTRGGRLRLDEEPVPTHFLSLRPGARFLAVIEAPTTENRALVERLLEWTVDHLLAPALAEDGIGARTSSGYGRFAVEGRRPRKPRDRREIAYVTWSRERSELQAEVGSEVLGRVTGAAAMRILDELSERTRERLERGRSVRLRVTLAGGNGVSAIQRVDER